MSKKILSTSIIQAVANNIRRLRNITSEIQPKNFDEELKKVFSLDSHLMRQVSEKVKEQFGVELEAEVKRLGEF